MARSHAPAAWGLFAAGELVKAPLLMPERTSPLEASDTSPNPGTTGQGTGLEWLLAGLLVLGLLSGGFLFLRHARRDAELERAFWVVGHKAFSVAERQAAFQQLVAAGNVEWRGAYLGGLNLADFKLPGVDLHDSDMEGSNLVHATLSRARVRNVRLALADLTDADFSEADVTASNLFKAHLARASFRQARLRGAVLEQVNATDAVFLAADLGEAQLLMADLTGANFTSADLTGASLEAAVLRRANLTFTLMAGVDLKDADFTDANWWRARRLTSEQLAWLNKSFPPTANAPAGLRQDYEAWLKESAGRR